MHQFVNPPIAAADEPPHLPTETRVAVLVDCDNTIPDILDFALRVVAQFGRVMLRRGYGNHTTLSRTWQEAFVRQAFTPCLQYQYVAGKNTADIGLGQLGQSLKSTNLGFSPAIYGHSGRFRCPGSDRHSFP